MSTLFRLEFVAKPSLLRYVRRFVQDFFNGILESADASERLAMTTHELLENALKYSEDGYARMVVESGDSGEVVVSVSNRAEQRHIASLRDAFRAMEGVSADAYYQRAMERISPSSESSGLGLARIRAEGEMNLSLEVAGERDVSLRATAPLGGVA